MDELHAFDLDHTLVKVNSSFKFGVYLYQQQHFSFQDMLWLIATYGRFQLLGMEIDKLHHHTFRTLFHGRDRHVIASAAERFIETLFADFAYMPALERLKLAQQKQHRVALFSSGPDFLVGPIAQKLGVDFWSATHYPSDVHGRLTKSPKVLKGDDKARLLIDLAGQLSLPRESITVYSDSILDLPFLRAGGKPVAVRPDRSLRRLSHHESWEVL